MCFPPPSETPHREHSRPAGCAVRAGLFGTRKGRREKWLSLASSPCGPDIPCLLLLPGPLYPGRGAGKQVRVGAGSPISP